MARSELDKLLAATHTKSTSGRPEFTRLMADVLRLGRTVKLSPARESVAPRLPAQRAIKAESTVPSRLLKAVPAAPASAPIKLPGSNNDLGRLAAQIDGLQRAMTPASERVAVK